MNNSLEGLSSQTQRVIGRLAFNEPLDVPATVDYGVDSQRHYRALREAISYYSQPGDTEEKEYLECRERFVALEQARGNGKAITAFVRKYAPEFSDVVFQTSWDKLTMTDGE